KNGVQVSDFHAVLSDHTLRLQRHCCSNTACHWQGASTVQAVFGTNIHPALVQLNGDNFLFYNKSLGDLNVEKFTHKHPRSIDGVNDVWHAYPHSSRNLHDIGIARKLDWRLYKRLF